MDISFHLTYVKFLKISKDYMDDDLKLHMKNFEIISIINSFVYSIIEYLLYIIYKTFKTW